MPLYFVNSMRLRTENVTPRSEAPMRPASEVGALYVSPSSRQRMKSPLSF